MKFLIKFKTDLLAACILFLTSIFTVVDLFLVPGRSANMDGIVHTVTPNLFYLSIKQGEFPVGWIDGFANYGLPLGIISHQVTAYLTAFIEFMTRNPVTAFNILAFFGFFLSLIFFYVFLRIYFSPVYAFAGVLFFHFAPYRILNLYIRGAMPEFFAEVFIPLLLISLYLIISRKKIYGLFLFSLSTTLLALTHPFMILISAFIALPYLAFLLFENQYFLKKSLFSKESLRVYLFLLISGLIGLGIAGYFLIPLTLEIKYFYYGLASNHLTPGNFLGLSNYLDPNWYYFTKINILPRGFIVNFGLVETLIIVAGVILLIYMLLKKEQKRKHFLLFALVTCFLIIFFTTRFSDLFYLNINFLSNIQFPWRLLSVLIFLPPIIAIIIFEKLNSKIVMLIFLAFVCFIRFPQLYGKNYVLYPASDYSFTSLNLHAVVMNPIWTGESTTYPVEQSKPAILTGKGKIEIITVKNNLRVYRVNADTDLRMIDYTFYFPGWNVYVNGVKMPIEYQDPNYRGVITYNVPKGKNMVELKFEDTKVRLISKIVSLASVSLFVLLFFFRKKIKI